MLSEAEGPAGAPNAVLRQWNALDPASAGRLVLPCCGSEAWAAAVAAERPFADQESLLNAAERIWFSLAASDWQQAFDSHPRIGERDAQHSATARSLAWSAAEQSAAMRAGQAERDALREANRRYEQRFGRIFIICARGRSAGEILAELQRRLGNSAEEELREAAREQAKITELRLKQWLGSA